MTTTPINNEVLAEAAEPVAQTTWGEGEGLNGEVLAPSDVDSLIDLISRIEFKNELNTDDYIRYSNIETKGYFFDDYTVASGEVNLGAQISIGGWSSNGTDWNGQSIEKYNGSTVIEYGENVKEQFGKRDFIRQLNAALQISDDSSGYIFLQPDHFRVQGLIGGNGRELLRYNSNGNKLTDLAETADIDIDISTELADEVSTLVANSRIEFEQSDIESFTSDFGAQGDITIKIADYLDDGRIDASALNDDIRFTLEIDTDAASRLSVHDTAYARVNLISEPNNDSIESSLHLTSRDHDNPSGFSGYHTDVTTFLETTDDSGTSFELDLEEWSLEDAARNLQEGEFTKTFVPDYTHVAFDTISGYHSHSISGDQLAQLTNSIQSITIDFSGYEIDSDNSDGTTEDIFLSINPLVDIIDLSSISNNDELVEFQIDEVEYGGFWGNYRLIDSDNIEVGNFRISGHKLNNEHTDAGQYINANVWNENVVLDNLTASLEGIGLSGDKSMVSGNVSLRFNHDPDDGSLDLSRIDGRGWGEEFQSDNGSGELPGLEFNGRSLPT